MTTTVHKEYYSTGELYRESYMERGMVHRVDGPAAITYNIDGSIDSEEYCYNNCYHRDGDLPARILYHDNGKICTEIYVIMDRRHRAGKPARIEYDKCGKKEYEIYFLNDMCHNTSGPAVINYITNRIEYYVYAKKMSENAFNKKYFPHLYIQKPRIFTIKGKKYVIDCELPDSTIILKLAV